MVAGPDESRVPTAAPAVLDQPSRVGLFINAVAMIGFGAACISHLQGVPEVGGVRTSRNVVGVKVCCRIRTGTELKPS